MTQEKANGCAPFSSELHVYAKLMCVKENSYYDSVFRDAVEHFFLNEQKLSARTIA